MGLLKRGRTTSVGGLAGVMIAVAGGLGVAVGLYDLPRPQDASVASEVYTKGTQRAVAAATLRADEYGTMILHIEVMRGAEVREHVDRPRHDPADPEPGPTVGPPNESNMQRAGVWVEAHTYWCSDQPFGDGCGPEEEWRQSGLPTDSFEFDPLLNAASFSGEVQGCTFHVVWDEPEGDIVPFEDHDHAWESRIAPPPEPPVNLRSRAFAVAELSRVVRADIDMSGDACFEYSRDGAPGYLAQGAGLDSTWTDVTVE